MFFFVVIDIVKENMVILRVIIRDGSLKLGIRELVRRRGILF